MIKFEKFSLSNGLKVIVNTDRSTPLVAMNILYMVGARDEDPEKTGFAHLFEHLMFGGSENIPDYDRPLQMAGGENNAFTNNDFTNYYLTIPAPNLETAFWLESDRMLNLAFSPKSLEVQRSVVVEEFRQRYLNQPYGDTWLLLRPLAYKVHPYRWATIGKEISHITDATLDDVKSFFKRYYHPGNAILTLSGNVTPERARALAEKWFGPVPAGEKPQQYLPPEPLQNEKRELTVMKDVPFDSLVKAWHSCSRRDPEYHATDLMTDILSGGKSSRFYNNLVRKGKLFTNVHAYQLGDLDKSLVVAEGKLVKGVSIEAAEKALDAEIESLMQSDVKDAELIKVKQKTEAGIVFNDMSIENKALNLAYFEMLGNAEDHNHEIEKYQSVSPSDIKNVARTILKPENSSVLHYLSKN